MPSRSKLLCCLYSVQKGISLASRSAFALQNGSCANCVYGIVRRFCLRTQFVQNGVSFVSLYPLSTKWCLISLSCTHSLCSEWCLVSLCCTHFVQNGVSFLSLVLTLYRMVSRFCLLYSLCTEWCLVSLYCTHFLQNDVSFLSIVLTLYRMVSRFSIVLTLYRMVSRFHLSIFFC